MTPYQAIRQSSSPTPGTTRLTRTGSASGLLPPSETSFCQNEPAKTDFTAYETMSNPPRISLIYRPVRIGWVVEDGSLSQLVTATSWSTCLWGGRFNPIIPMDDAELANNLIATFGVDVLIPVVASDSTSAFI